MVQTNIQKDFFGDIQGKATRGDDTMPRKRPPNAEATQFKAGEQQVEIARKGGHASAQSQKDKKTVQKILNDFLDQGVSENKTVEALARKAGLSTSESVKDLVTIVCVLNTLKRGSVDELEKLARLLGEKTVTDDTETKAQESLMEAIKRAVKDG